MSKTSLIDGTHEAYDFHYTHRDGDEYTNHRVTVEVSSGTGISDPTRGASGQYDDTTDGKRIDTWFNTPSSANGSGPASYVYDVYDPTGASPDPEPTLNLSWAVYDTVTGDGMDFDLGRLLVSPDTVATVFIKTYDLESSGVGEEFNFAIPEPATLGLLICGGLALLRRSR